MKKSRQGVIVSVLCRPENPDPLRETLFRHSTAIGFREKRVNRLFLRREEKQFPADFSEGEKTFRQKTVFLGEEELRSKIEYEDRARLAREKGVSLREAEKMMKEGNI
jgi:uncharacterized protein (DUF111 family)